MKKVVMGNELQKALEEAINLLCNTVKKTIGPKGSNVIIDHSTFSPFITNDGVTIAENIESEDPVINTILELTKESSIKTNEEVGDGTTTTLVLLQSIFNNGLKLIREGLNPIVLKKELDKSLEKVEKLIKTKSREINKDDIKNLISISANDKIIGDIISDAYFKIGNTKGINIYEGNENITKIEYLKGYTFDTVMASSYYFINQKNIIINNGKIILIDNTLQNVEDIAIIINKLINENKDLIIIAKDYSENLINDIIVLNMELTINIYLLKSPYYGNQAKYFYDDIKDITNSKIVNNVNNLTLDDLGLVKKININKDYTNIEFNSNNIITQKLIELKSDNNPCIDKLKRISMLDKGLVNIIVGAPTTTERREKKMRFDDALCSLNSIQKGVIKGCGVTLLEVSDNLKIENNGDNILKEALNAPFNEIMNNAGLNKNDIEKEIKNNNYNLIYNINTEVFENTLNTEVIDSTKVILCSLTNAVSIAGMLLTTNSLIINEYQNNINKINDYNEL